MPLNPPSAAVQSPPRPVPEAGPGLFGRSIGKLVGTPPDAALTVVRLTLGAVMFAHATQKVFGWFGGPGLEASLQGFTSKMGLPLSIAVLVVLAEFMGSIGLVLGFLGRIAASGILGVMIGAIALVHYKVGFFMNWFGTQKGEGFEYHLLAIAMALAVLIRGSGAFSIDARISSRWNRRQAQ